MARIKTPGWSTGRSQRGPVVRVRPVCRSCGQGLRMLPSNVVPVFRDEEHDEIISRRCSCGEPNRVKVRRAK